jgi:hypothetical protein
MVFNRIMRRNKTNQAGDEQMKKKAEHVGKGGKKFYDEKPSPKGYTPCPECGKYVATALVGPCPNPECNHVFVRKEKARAAELSSDNPMMQALAVFDLLDTLANQIDLDTVLPALGRIDATADQLMQVLEAAKGAGGLDRLVAAWAHYSKRRAAATAG